MIKPQPSSLSTQNSTEASIEHLSQVPSDEVGAVRRKTSVQQAFAVSARNPCDSMAEKPLSLLPLSCLGQTLAIPWQHLSNSHSQTRMKFRQSNLPTCQTRMPASKQSETLQHQPPRLQSRCGQASGTTIIQQETCQNCDPAMLTD